MEDRERFGTDPESLSPEQAAQLEEEQERRLPALFRPLDAIFKVLIAVMLCVLVVTVGANVTGRFVFNYSLAWADELSRYVFIWVIFIGAALAYFRDEHISVDLLVKRLGSRAAAVLNLIRDLLVLAVLLVLLWGSVGVLTTFAQSSAILGVPLRLVNVSVPIAAALMTLMCGYKIANDLRLLASGGS